MECCVLCKKTDTDTDTEKLSVVYEKGYNTLLRVSREKDQGELRNQLASLKKEGKKILVHPKCRKSFIDCRNTDEKEIRQSKRLKSTDDSFDWKSLCFICGYKIDTKRLKDLIREVSTIEFH